MNIDTKRSASPRAGRPWLWVVVLLGLFVAANLVTLVIACANPPVLVP